MEWPAIIECPQCGSPMTHLVSLDVYPSGEDDDCPSVKIDMVTGDMFATELANPSPRRNGLRLHMACESGCDFRINLLQHKGVFSINEDEG